MKRYLLFAFDYYYPYGGMEDFKCDLDNLENLNDILKNIKEGKFHIYDTELKEYVIEDIYIDDYLKK